MANVGVIANYPLFHGFFPNGDPLIGGKLYTYRGGHLDARGGLS